MAEPQILEKEVEGSPTVAVTECPTCGNYLLLTSRHIQKGKEAVLKGTKEEHRIDAFFYVCPVCEDRTKIAISKSKLRLLARD